MTMRLITLYVPEPWLTELEELVQKGLFANRADAIRVAIHDLIQRGGK